RLQDIKPGETPLEWKNRIWNNLMEFRKEDVLPLSTKKYLLARKVVNWENRSENDHSICEPIGYAICYKCNNLIYNGEHEDPSYLGMEIYHKLMVQHQQKCIGKTVNEKYIVSTINLVKP
ncbi:14237_t:CDS:1, partial [Funneliformis mosseae]